MQFSKIGTVIFFFVKYSLSASMEPMCSKFSCEEQLLEKVIRQEIKFEMIQNDIKKTEESALNTLETIKSAGVENVRALETIQTNFSALAKRTVQDIEKNEEALRKMFDGLRTNLTKEIEEQRMFVTKAVEDMKKPSVAFFAHNVVDNRLDKTDKIIVFTTTTTNEGSGYDTSTGIFTAPVGGFYHFIVNYCSFTAQHSPLALILSGNVVARSNNYDKDGSTCTSYSAVIRVEIGEKVWVKCVYGGSSYGLQRTSWYMNSFSGFLI